MNKRNKVSLFIPKFENGKVLNEKHLYQLARLPVDCFRLAIACRGRTGFFAPLALNRDKNFWNHIELKISGSHEIHNLFLISQNGFPFIVEGVTELPNRDLNKTVLFARATFPTCHDDYKNNKGYGVDFSWGDPPESTDENSPVVELGKLVENGDDRRFAFTPPAATLGSTKGLHDAGQSLRQVAEAFCKSLIAHKHNELLNNILLIDRIERLTLISDAMELGRLILEIKLLLKSLKIFLTDLSMENDMKDVEISILKDATAYDQHNLIEQLISLLRKLTNTLSNSNLIPINPVEERETCKIYRFQISTFINVGKNKLTVLFDREINNVSNYHYKFNDQEEYKKIENSDIKEKNKLSLKINGPNFILSTPKNGAIPTHVSLGEC